MLIKEIGKVVTGKTPSTFRPEYYGDGFMFISPTELHTDFSIKESEKHITEAGINAILSNSISGLSVLVGCIGWDMGNVAIVDAKCATNQQINSITSFSKGVSPYYVYYWLKGKKDYLFRLANVTRTPILSKGDFEDIDIPLPDKTVQDSVANVLVNVDRKIENNKDICDTLESIVKLIYDYWFIQFDFPDNNGKPYKANGGKMVWNDKLKREIPEGWDVDTVGSLITEREKSSVQVGEAEGHVGNVPFFTSGDAIIMYDTPLTEGRNCFLNTGGNADVKYYIGEAAYSTDTWCITAGTYSSYLFEYIDSIRKYLDISFFAGSGLKHLQKDAFKSHRLILPPDTLVRKFNETADKCFTKVSEIKIESQYLSGLRDFLLPLLMNGQVKVKHNKHNPL